MTAADTLALRPRRATRPPAGDGHLRLENDGSHPAHARDRGHEDDFKLEVSRGGDTDDGTIELEAGDYVFYCDVPGHRAAGMEGTLTVE